MYELCFVAQMRLFRHSGKHNILGIACRNRYPGYPASVQPSMNRRAVPFARSPRECQESFALSRAATCRFRNDLRRHFHLGQLLNSLIFLRFPSRPADVPQSRRDRNQRRVSAGKRPDRTRSSSVSPRDALQRIVGPKPALERRGENIAGQRLPDALFDLPVRPGKIPRVELVDRCPRLIPRRRAVLDLRARDCGEQRCGRNARCAAAAWPAEQIVERLDRPQAGVRDEESHAAGAAFIHVPQETAPACKQREAMASSKH